ncbi:MAG: hypothetical protein AUG44_06760 [Actinobacteria bacterium 13_1_20CM_3_71_11]|nr:MAG: hypothetical protein AUG44_06760 [Actinobacteria bacterium 13_1_20CM_3_71_11]
MRKTVIGVAALVLAAGVTVQVAAWSASTSSPTFDTSTLAGKVASVHGTAGLQIRMSAFAEQEAEPSNPADVLGPDGVSLIEPGGGSVKAPDTTVNQDTAAAPQNETSIAVDPNRPDRIVAGANDYVTRTWSCTVGGTPCSALGDGYSGTYYSNDGGKTWCCSASDPQHLGTLIPGVSHLAGGPYDAGGDPAVAFDSRGAVYYAGLGFNRNSAPNTVTVNRGTFGTSGGLSWSQPTFINPTTSPAVFNDKEWIAADWHASSRYRDRVYVTWTRFLFNSQNGNYVQSPIFEAHSTDGGATFSAPQSISGNVLYDQGSRVFTGADGTVYAVWEGATRLSTLDGTYFAKSTDGGVTWSKPALVATLVDFDGIKDTAFRVNSFPAGAVAPNGTLYASWTTDESDRAVVVYSTSTDGGAHWSAPVHVPGVDVARTPVGYAGTGLTPPAARPAESIWPSVTVSPTGKVFIGAYVGDVVSPWQSCATYDPKGSVNCQTTGPLVNNTKLDYVVTDLSSGVTGTATTQSINTRYQFRGGFIGDYTDMSAGSDGVAHPFWTDTNNAQHVSWWYGSNFGDLLVSQQDVVTTRVTY